MLLQRIEEDFKTAVKARDSIKVETLRMVKAALSNYLIDKRKQSAEDTELITLIQKQVKMRQESIESYKLGKRDDLVSKETKEKMILEAYLPKGLSDEELSTLIKSVIQELGAKAPQDMGKVMKEVVSKVQGRADGKRVSELVSTFLKK